MAHAQRRLGSEKPWMWIAGLKPGGRFVLIEYDTDTPNHPLVPNPVSLERFKRLAEEVGLTELNLIATRPSVYNHNHMYAIQAAKG